MWLLVIIAISGVGGYGTPAVTTILVSKIQCQVAVNAIKRGNAKAICIGPEGERYPSDATLLD